MGKKVFSVAEAISRVQQEMDAQAEVNIDTPEYIIYINDAIDEAEAEIHSMNEEYFLTSSLIDVVAGTAQYPLPTDIYANKLKHVQFKRNRTDMYKIERIKPWQIARAEEITDVDPQWYLIRNDGTTDGVEIEFFPTPATTESGLVRLWYLRNAERVAVTTDLIDLPEFASFVFAYLKFRVAMKEMSPLTDAYTGELQHQRELMKRSLSDMIVDEQETLPLDPTYLGDSFDYGYGDW